MTEQVKADSFVTLHYRLCDGDGFEFINTFTSKPATLQMGVGQLAPPLEACLLGMGEGTRQIFALEPDEAFGKRSDDMVRRVARSEIPDTVSAELHAQVDFMAENGTKFSGLIRQIDHDSVLLDFNHPLAGKHLSFEAQVIGVL